MNYSTIRDLLFNLEPEQAHHLTLQLLRLAGAIPPVRGVLRRLYAAPHQPVEVFGLKFNNRVGLAAGYDKDGEALVGLGTLGFGHIEMGTVTSRPQPGNPKPRVFRLIEDEAVINRMGFPSKGTEYAQARLNPNLTKNAMERISGFDVRKAKKIPTYPFVLGINIGKNKDTPNEEAVLDYLSLLQNFARYADYIAINVSSPNTAGLRSLQGRQQLSLLLKSLHDQRKMEEISHKKKLPLLVKIAPDLSEAELEDAVGVIVDEKMDGIIATNTTIGRTGLSSAKRDEIGGLSGKPLTKLSDDMLEKVVKLAQGRVPVVGVGGIMDEADAQRKLDLGASLVQVYTGLIYRGPGLVKRINKALVSRK